MRTLTQVKKHKSLPCILHELNPVSQWKNTIEKIEFHGSQVAETEITAKHPPTDSVAVLFFWQSTEGGQTLQNAQLPVSVEVRKLLYQSLLSFITVNTKF